MITSKTPSTPIPPQLEPLWQRVKEGRLWTLAGGLESLTSGLAMKLQALSNVEMIPGCGCEHLDAESGSGAKEGVTLRLSNGRTLHASHVIAAVAPNW